jgi:hypothetical protein
LAGSTWNQEARGLAIVEAFQDLSFAFDLARNASALPDDSSFVGRGFSPDAVMEVRLAPRLCVSLLLSTGADLAWSAQCMRKLAEVTSIDCGQWLIEQLVERGVDTPWRTSWADGDSVVSAEFLCADAVLVCVQVGADSAQRDNRQASC